MSNLITVNEFRDSTISVSRGNVREVDLEFDTGITNTRIRLANETAREMVEQIINLIGMEVVIPVKSKERRP